MTIECPKCHSHNADTASFCSDCGTSLTPSPDISQTKILETLVDKFTRGTLIADRYEIIEKLGAGGMGQV